MNFYYPKDGYLCHDFSTPFRKFQVIKEILGHWKVKLGRLS